MRHVDLLVLTNGDVFSQLPIPVHTSLELSALGVITIGLLLKLRWLGVRTVFTHYRTLIKVGMIQVLSAHGDLDKIA